VRIAADGQIAFLDHERTELKRGLLHFDVAGIAPTGCHGAYVVWRDQLMRPNRGPRPAVLHGRPGIEFWTFVQRQVDCGAALHALRACLRAERAVVSRVPRTRTKHRTWLVAAPGSQSLTAMPAHGLPPALCLDYAGGAHVWGGLVAVRMPAGDTVVWDVALPGVGTLVADGTGQEAPGVIMLARLSRRLLGGWRGLLREAGERQRRADAS
jgi:hypothetical protein